MAEKRATEKTKDAAIKKKKTKISASSAKKTNPSLKSARKSAAKTAVREKGLKAPSALSSSPARQQLAPRTKKQAEQKTQVQKKAKEEKQQEKKVVRVEIVKKEDVLKRKALEEAREAELREQEAREQALHESVLRDQEAREKEAREQAERERTMRDQIERERVAREQAERERAEREQALRAQAERERALLREQIQAVQAQPQPTVQEKKKPAATLPFEKREIREEKKFVKVPVAVQETSVKEAEKEETAAEGPLVKIKVSFPLTVGDLAPQLNKTPNELIKHLMLKGKMMTINQHLDEESAKKIAFDLGFELEVVDPLELQEEQAEVEDPGKLKPRPPVVTVMGHVDHGKTSLLDAIRSANVTASEEGGITQRIGAYQVELNSRKITFLDTPGHEAFTAMRARGTKITDVAVLVVAADDGVMPQTIEAIDHARAANVPIVVALNKIDKPSVNVDRVKQQLSDHGLVPEEWGGTTVFVPVSAKQKTGLEDLMEMILLVADLAELKANPDKFARGTIIEAKLDRGKGPVATVLIQEGSLRVGDSFVAGKVHGKIRAFINDRGERISEAPPALPVEIVGLNDVPEAGDLLQVVADEKLARQIADARALHSREQTLASLKRVTLDDLYQQIKEGEIKDLNIILKADGQGSVEALRDSLERLSTDEVRVRIIHTGVGTITESDVMLASASNAIIIGFNIRPEPHIKNLAEREKVDLKLYRVIYQAIEEIKQAMVGMRKPTYRESVIGRAEVLRTFKISKVGTIAGCRVTDGKITRDAEVRVIRDGAVVYEGKLASLKRFKDDAREVMSGYECGIGIEKFNDLKEKDVFEAFVMEEVRHTDLAGKVEVS